MVATGMLGFLALYIVLMVIGIVVAKRPLARPGFWLRHGIVFIVLIALLIAGEMIAGAPGGAAASDEDIVRIFVFGGVFVLVVLVANTLMTIWSAQRLIDIGWSRWWALAVGLLFPIPTIIFGVVPTRPAISEGAALETFG